MSVDLLESADVTVELVPAVRPASAALAVYKPSSSTAIESPTVTADGVKATVSAVVAQDELTLTSVAGVAAGRAYWWASVNGGLGGLVRVSEIDGSTVLLEAPVPGTARAGDDFVGARLTAPLTGALLTPRALHWRLEWRVTDTAGATHDYTVAAHVVRQRSAPPMSAAEAARYVQSMYPTDGAQTPSPLRWQMLAERASRRVRRLATQQSRYVHLVGDEDVWADAGDCALRIELAREGLYPVGVDASVYRREQEDLLPTLISDAMAGTPYDEDDSGTVDADEEVRTIGSIGMVRR